MALTRKMLKAMGIEDEKIDQIIEAHTETVDALKEKAEQYKKDAEALPDVQKQLDDLKKDSGNGGYKKKYEDEHAAYEAYKSNVAAKESAAAKEKAARAYFQGKGIPAESMALVIRGAKAEIDGLELDGEKIKDSKALDDLLSGDYKCLIGKEIKTGTRTQTPPETTGGGKMTKEQIMEIKDTAQRQAAMLENAELFGIS
nr:MAG TPA: minor structural protein [Caudoviricetes sp.]